MKEFAITAVLLLVGVLAAPAAWAGKVDCLMCHPEKARGGSVHSAVRTGCGTCHIGVDASEVPHKMTSGVSMGLPAGSTEICFSCHDRADFLREKTVHAPVSGGMCTSCHDPHASGFKSLLLSGDICFNCHDRAEFVTKKNVHSPVSGGTCVNCHDPHGSRGPRLLKAGNPDLCFSCHAEEKFQGPVTHAPVTLGMCTSCHEPHQSNGPRLTVSGIPELCFSCHDREDVEKKTVHASAGAGCTACHRPHAARNRFLLD